MDRPNDHDLEPEEAGNVTRGVSSSLELNNVKHVLSVKMETPESHYTTITPLGKGSFGQVHSAHDTLLGREVAIKSLKSQFREEEEIVDRFLKEARGNAQLEHPNIMPVHEMGVTDDLGIYFTMKKIDGENLKEILDRLEANTSFYLKKYPLIRLLEIFLAVCNGVAFAHSKGVIHRDLKPANIMIGEFGEVLILDWGLVKTLDSEDGEGSGVQLRMEEFEDAANNTMDGAISGTPNYMSPEQAEGKIDDVDFLSDIYSLGAILYHILTHLPPFEKTQLRKLLENVKVGNFKPPRERCPGLKISRELDAICMKAMSRFQVNRYRTVEDLADDIRNYMGHRDVSAYRAPPPVRFLNACRRHPVRSGAVLAALVAFGLTKTIQRSRIHGEYTGKRNEAVEKSRLMSAQIQEATITYERLLKLRNANLTKTPTPEEEKTAGKLREQLIEQSKNFILAIGFYEGIPERYSRNADVVQGYTETVVEQVNFALLRKEYAIARLWLETAVERKASLGLQLSEEMTAYTNAVHRQVEGWGSLVINEAPNLDEVTIWPIKDFGGTLLKQYDMYDRASVFPKEIKYMDKGSLLLQITTKSGDFVPYPVYIDHNESKVVTPVLPEKIPEGTVFIPGGTFFCGGVDSRFLRLHEVEEPSFFIKKFEVTIAEYLEFWKQLDDVKDKVAYMSRIRFRHDERKYVDAWDANGNPIDRVQVDFPVVGISHKAAIEFCDWKSTQLGLKVTLPTATQWEKAARGVDGRVYPWGNGYSPDENLAHTKSNKKGVETYPIWAPPGKFIKDNSVYNVRDMGGNVREMTLTPLYGSESLAEDIIMYQIKGGSFATPDNFLPCSNSSDTPVVPSDVGFRYVIKFEE